MAWLSNNIVGILGTLAGIVVAYHVHRLSKRIDLKDDLAHKDAIKKQVEPLLYKVNYEGINSKVELVNIKKYKKHYTKVNKSNRDGYTYLGAEIKGLRFDGIEFFCEVIEVYKKADGKLTLEKSDGFVPEPYNIFVVGLIPYEWIEYFDIDGNEFSYNPQFFTRFNGEEKSPYKYLIYYKKSEADANDPPNMKWASVRIEG